MLSENISLRYLKLRIYLANMGQWQPEVDRSLVVWFTRSQRVEDHNYHKLTKLLTARTDCNQEQHKLNHCSVLILRLIFIPFAAFSQSTQNKAIQPCNSLQSGQCTFNLLIQITERGPLEPARYRRRYQKKPAIVLNPQSLPRLSKRKHSHLYFK